MRISDWSSDVCSSDLLAALPESDVPEAPAPKPAVAASYTGLASWYGAKFHGRLTASGERYDMAALNAAHQTLPFGSRVRVTNLANSRFVEAVSTDRGPRSEHRRGGVARVSLGRTRGA